MVTLEQIRVIAANLPFATESLHFRLPTFRIGDNGFITVQKDAAIMALPQDLSEMLQRYKLNKDFFSSASCIHWVIAQPFV